jgi:hypothetical protein
MLGNSVIYPLTEGGWQGARGQTVYNGRFVAALTAGEAISQIAREQDAWRKLPGGNAAFNTVSSSHRA